MESTTTYVMHRDVGDAVIVAVLEGAVSYDAAHMKGEQIQKATGRDVIVTSRNVVMLKAVPMSDAEVEAALKLGKDAVPTTAEAGTNDSG